MCIRDSCSSGTGGTSPNTAKDQGTIQCGDGLKHPSETCEDGNTSSGDGCSASGLIENLHVCSGGTTTNADSGNLGLSGTSPNTPKSMGKVQCGDGIKHVVLEEGEDNNTSPGDGGDSNGRIEDTYIGNGGSTSGYDTGSQCPDGTEPNISKTSGDSQGGDGKKHAAEEGDDGNSSFNDGCNSGGKIEPFYIGTGGTTLTSDTGTLCTGGTSPDSSKTSCQVQCGDGVRHSSEEGDDQNSANGDGGDSTCHIETGYFCKGGSVSTRDTCTICSDGYVLNSLLTECVNVGGDGKRVTEEEGDDKNTDDGDGCTSDCKIEDNFVGAGGSNISRDICSPGESCLLYTSPQNPKTPKPH